MIVATAMLFTATCNDASHCTHRQCIDTSDTSSLMQRSFVKLTVEEVSKDQAQVDEESPSPQSPPPWTSMGTYVKSQFNSPCPFGSTLINDKTECFQAYNSMKVAQGWTGGTSSGTWGHVMQCGVHIALGHGLLNGNTIVHFKLNYVDGSSPGEDWLHICKKQPAPPPTSAKYLKSNLNSACPAGYGLINDKTECFRAYNSLKVAEGWSGGTTSGNWAHVMQCGVHMASTRGSGNGNTYVHFKPNHVDGSSPSEDWLHICKKTAQGPAQPAPPPPAAKYMKSNLNSACPAGYGLI